MLFKTCCQTKNLISRFFAIGLNTAYAWLCRRKRARFIEHNNIGFGHCFEVTRSLDDKAVLGAFALRRHNGNRARELQRTGIINHKRRSCLRKITRGKRHHACQQEVPRNKLVGHVFDTLLRCRFHSLRLLHKRHNRANLACLGVARDKNANLAILHRSAGIHGIALRAHDGKRLTGKRALVHCRLAAYDFTINGNGIPQTRDYHIALLKLVKRNFNLQVSVKLTRSRRNSHKALC